MLILTRKSDESIVIGHGIRVTVLRVQGNQVHLGITAPPEVPVHRQEIYAQVQETNRDAVHGAAADLQSGLGQLQRLLGQTAAPRASGGAAGGAAAAEAVVGTASPAASAGAGAGTLTGAAAGRRARTGTGQ